MADEERIRSFLAIDLPGEIKDGMGRIQERLISQISGVRWTRPEGIHLTIKFFGDISKDDMLAISRAVENIALNVSPFSLSIGGLGAFPGLRRPRVLWIGMEGDLESLSMLQQEIDLSLEACGFKREERGFNPHLTLGRFRTPGETADLEKIFEKKNAYRAGEFTAQGLTLFKSALTPKGALYTVLKFFPFGGNNPLENTKQNFKKNSPANLN